MFQTFADSNFRRMLGLDDGAPLPTGFEDDLAALDSRHRDATPAEREAYVLMLLKRMAEPSSRRTPEENLAAWERGWSENLALIERDGVTEASLTPRYNRPKRYLRCEGRLLVCENPHLEHALFRHMRAIVFERWLRPFDGVIEIGCGSGQNVLALAKAFPEKRIGGFDWTAASNRIVARIGEAVGRPIEARRFDVTAPPDDLTLAPSTALLTVHALEQIGERHDGFVDFVLRARPALVVNVEPVLELYDHDDLLDYLAWSYSVRRDYLAGYYTRLRQLEGEGRVEIVALQRTRLGGEIHEGNTLLIWRPR